MIKLYEWNNGWIDYGDKLRIRGKYYKLVDNDKTYYNYCCKEDTITYRGARYGGLIFNHGYIKTINCCFWMNKILK